MPLLTVCLALASGLGAGLLSGLFGIGGGALAVPMLMLQGAEIHQAAALSLVYIFWTSFSGSLVHGLQGRLEVAPVAILGCSASLSIFVGLRLAQGFSPAQLAGAFAGFMLLVLCLNLLRQRFRPTAEVVPKTGWKRGLTLALTGLLAGLIASLLGVGGGVIMVPLLMLLGGHDLKAATALSLAGVCLIALIGASQHALWGHLLVDVRHFGLNLLLMSAAGMCAAPLGVQLNRRLPVAWLRGGFVTLCLVVMSYMLFKALHTAV